MVVPRQRQVSGGRVYNESLCAALRARGWTVTVVELAGSWPRPTEAQRQTVAEAVLGGGPDSGPVLVDGLIGSACPAELRAAERAGVQVVLLVHLPLPAETGVDQDEQQRLAELELQAVSVVTAVATTSRWAAANLTRRYGRGDVAVLSPGVEPSPVATGSAPPRLLVLATLTPVKNHATLLTALDALADLAWQVCLVGPAPHDGVRRDIRGWQRVSPVADRVQVTGELTGAELESIWAGTDLLLLPSLTETFGLVVTEALARGIPAVVSRGTGAEETLRGTSDESGDPDDGPPGAVADSGDPAQWAATIRAWLTDDELRADWRARALQRRARLRPWAQTAADLDHLLEEVR